MKKVMVFGTFDLLHPGHLNFFRQAKKLGNFLIVVVARDKYVSQAKGKPPKNSEFQRIKAIRKLPEINKAVLGSKTHNFFQTIRTYKPRVLALGYDQKPRLTKLKKDLNRHRIKDIKSIRLRAYKPKIYKTSLILDANG